MPPTTRPEVAGTAPAPTGETVDRTAPGALVLPLRALGAGSLAIAGGKAANLGILLQADLPVPDGFCVTTDAYAVVAAATRLIEVVARLAGVPPDDVAQLAALAGEARAPVWPPRSRPPLPRRSAAYRDLRPVRRAGPVAVRSSATAEDLPSASFAGQQDTYLNIVGEEALLDAVRRCWASLWTDRAVAYRAANKIDHAAVRLAVVVQRMVACQRRRRPVHRQPADRTSRPDGGGCQPGPGRGGGLGRGQPGPLGAGRQRPARCRDAPRRQAAGDPRDGGRRHRARDPRGRLVGGLPGRRAAPTSWRRSGGEFRSCSARPRTSSSRSTRIGRRCLPGAVAPDHHAVPAAGLGSGPWTRASASTSR